MPKEMLSEFRMFFGNPKRGQTKSDLTVSKGYVSVIHGDFQFRLSFNCASRSLETVFLDFLPGVFISLFLALASITFLSFC